MKRFLVGFLTICLLVGSLSGCSPEQAQPGGSTAAKPGDPSVPNTIPEATSQPQAAELVISEVMPDNKYVTMGHAMDWVELYNREETPVSLDGYYLTDNPNQPQAMSLAGLTIQPDGYLVITLGEEAPFRLSADGESLWLMYGKTLVSTLTYEAPLDGESFDQEGASRSKS